MDATATRRRFVYTRIECSKARTQKIRHKRMKNLISGGAAKPEV